MPANVYIHQLICQILYIDISCWYLPCSQRRANSRGWLQNQPQLSLPFSSPSRIRTARKKCLLTSVPIWHQPSFMMTGSTLPESLRTDSLPSLSSKKSLRAWYSRSSSSFIPTWSFRSSSLGFNTDLFTNGSFEEHGLMCLNGRSSSHSTPPNQMIKLKFSSGK